MCLFKKLYEKIIEKINNLDKANHMTVCINKSVTIIAYPITPIQRKSKDLCFWYLIITKIIIRSLFLKTKYYI